MLCKTKILSTITALQYYSNDDVMLFHDSVIVCTHSLYSLKTTNLSKVEFDKNIKKYEQIKSIKQPENPLKMFYFNCNSIFYALHEIMRIVYSY